MVIEWIRRVPGLIRSAATGDAAQGRTQALQQPRGRGFQHAMLAEGPWRPPARLLVYANRLFDPDRVFEGNRGVAYGGPDLSDRNLRMLSALRGPARGESRRPDAARSSRQPAISARAGSPWNTPAGMHQLSDPYVVPASRVRVRDATWARRSREALHRLYFDPDEGFILWALHAAKPPGTGWSRWSRSISGSRERGDQSALEQGDLDPEPS